jgi:hypothetical protein
MYELITLLIHILLANTENEHRTTIQTFSTSIKQGTDKNQIYCSVEMGVNFNNNVHSNYNFNNISNFKAQLTELNKEHM